MIPKIVHFCWFGKNRMDLDVEKCIKTWKEQMPEYRFILWNEENFLLDNNIFVQQAYEAKKYAFVSDYVRLYALHKYGGIYFDCDVIVFRTFDKLLDNKAFIGFETEDSLGTCVIGSEKGNPIIKELMSYYDDRMFQFPDGSYDLTPNVLVITKYLEKMGAKMNNTFQKFEHITIFPRTFFCPTVPYGNSRECFSDNTFSQHMFNGSWISAEQRNILNKKHQIEKEYGRVWGILYYGFVTLKKEGVFSFVVQLRNMIFK